MYRIISLLSIILVSSVASFAQQPLPYFKTIKGPKNHVIVSWKNNFGDKTIVLNIQRSADSIRGFRTIYSSPAPSLSVNAYTDNKPIPGMDYYRIYYMLKNGSYKFTKAQKIATGFAPNDLLSRVATSKTIQLQGAVERTIPFKGLKKILDSVTHNTYDSLLFVNDSTLQYAKYNPVAALAKTNQSLTPVSKYLYVNADGYIVIRLPENTLASYSMIIYQQNGRSVLFKIKRFFSSEVILSKSSFMHTGWYPYELFKDKTLVERSKLEIRE